MIGEIAAEISTSSVDEQFLSHALTNPDVLHLCPHCSAHVLGVDLKAHLGEHVSKIVCEDVLIDRMMAL